MDYSNGVLLKQVADFRRCPLVEVDSILWSQWCPYYRGFTVQDSLLWFQNCPYYRGFTAQESLLWFQRCPYY